MGVADYDITIDGELAPEYVSAFAPHAVTTADGRSTIRATRLDDAGLVALLTSLGDLAVSVVRLERVERVKTATTGDDR